MTDRIDDYLEGRIERTDLTPSEQTQADSSIELASRVREFVARGQDPDVTAAVMSRIERLHATDVAGSVRGRFGRFVAGLWLPQRVSFQFRPVYGLALATAAVAILVFSGPSVSDSPQTATVSDRAQLFVQFRFQAADAMEVRLAGTFTNWEPRHELHETAPGIWTITLPLAPGVHDYVFVVNGREWVPDPHALLVDDGFGGTNSRIALLTPDTSRS